MKRIAVLIFVLMFFGSIPFFMGEDEVKGEGGDPQNKAPPTRGNTIIVDINGTGQYESIQEAINNSFCGDTILIKKGNYYENITLNKQLTIRGNGINTVLFFNNYMNCDIQTNNTIIMNLSIANTNKNYCFNIDNSINLIIDKLFFFVNLGIQIQDSNFIKIINSTFNNTKLALSLLDNSKNILIDNNKFYNCERNVKTSSDCIISNNIFTNSKYGLFFDKSNISILNNIFVNCSCYGNGKTLIFDKNNFVNTMSPHEIEGDKIYINNSKYFNSGQDTVIEILGSNYCSIDNIIIDKGGSGLVSKWSIKELIIKGSSFINMTNTTSSAILIDSHESTKASIINCIIENNNRGISLNSNYNEIYIINNIIKNNTVGINIEGSSSIIKNNLISNNKVGIIFGGTNHKVYNNDFLNNYEQFRPGGNGNSLYASYTSGGGNYWSDYQGKDKKSGINQDQWGSDGFGDIPYQIGTMNDKYPIIRDEIKPIANAGNDITIEEGDYYEFSIDKCSDNNLIMFVNWTYNYNNKSIILNNMVTKFLFNIPGYYCVKMIVYDFVKNNATDYINITVQDVRSPITISQGNLSCNEGSILWFNGKKSYDTGIISKYEWIFNYKGETRTLEGVNVSYFFDKPGIILVTLRVTDSAGHIGEDRFTVTVIDITDPLANAGPDILIDNEEMGDFNGSLSMDNGMLVNYNWTFEYNGQDILLEGKEATYKFEKPGIYNVTLTVTDQFGNKASDNLTVTVRDTKPPVAVITGLSSFLESENVKLSGKTSTDNGEIVKYEWDIIDNGSHVITGVDLNYKVILRGYHKVLLTVYDEWGNHATVNVTVNAIDGNKPFTSAGPDQEVAVGSAVTLDGTRSHDDGTIIKYEWSFTYDNQKQELIGKVVSFKFDKVGEYEVTLKVYDDNDNYGIDTLTVSVKDTGVVKGTVLGADGKPIGDALVEIVASDGKTYSVKTAPNGEFSIAIPPGAFTWKITKSEYGTITGASTVDVLGENTLDLSGTPMKKTVSTGTSPILFIIPIVIVLVMIIGIVIFLLMRNKRTAPETLEVKPEGEAIPPETAEGGAPAETPLPSEASDFVQAPPVMEEDVPIEKVEENTTVDDLLTEQD